MLSVLLISVPLGSYAIYMAVWRSHCRTMEPSLFRFIVVDDRTPPTDLEPFEFEHDGEIVRTEVLAGELLEPGLIYLGISRSDSDVLVPPSQSLIEKIGIPEIRPLKDTKDGECLFYIKIVKWIDWETVIVDYGSHDGPLSGGGSNGVKLRFVDGEWTIIEYDSFWVS
jgi:hypothetical protein